MKHRKPAWTPMVPATANGIDPFKSQLFINSRYQVAVRGPNQYPVFGSVYELSLKRLDKEPIYDWRDMQRIKNELFGATSSMVQLFPPERHLVDTSNQYWFFVFNDYEFPFGFKERILSNTPEVPNQIGGGSSSIQRPFEPHHMPPDLEQEQKSFDDLLERLPKVFR